MPASAAAALRPVPRPSPDEDHFVVMNGVDWKTYCALRELLDGAGLRMTYLQGALEIMSPSRTHEGHKKRIARLIELFALETDIALAGYGSTTLRHALKERGLEPDECYTVGRPLLDDGFPDLAIEVVITSEGINKLEIYAQMGVSEVWYWFQGEIRVFELTADGYVRSQTSKLLPGLDLVELANLVQEPDEHQALKTFRDRLRKR